MATTYRITVLGFALDTRECPPAIVASLFPAAPEPLSVSLSKDECLVTFASPQTPADLGPLVRVGLVAPPQA